MRVLYIVVIMMLLVGGCDYVPRKVYKIQTIDGDIINLLCPEVDQHRSTWSYIIDGECVLVK